MPKQTFFNLPIEKQTVLINSAKKEFSRVPLNKAVISNIVKDANIPRGSFYQYFEDKEDAFYYLLELQTKDNHSEFLLSLKRNKGDLFSAFIESYEKMLIEFQDPENQKFFKNTFLNMNYKMENKMSKGFVISKDNMDKQITSFFSHIDIEKINVANEAELMHVFQILIAVTFQNLMQNFAKKFSFEEALVKYKFEINLLKKGLSKD